MPELSLLRRLARERVLGRYIAALEKGDLETIAGIMRRAERDTLLEEMIFDLHESYQTEEEFLALVQEEQVMEIEGGIHKSQPRPRLSEGESARDEKEGLRESLSEDKLPAADQPPAPTSGRRRSRFGRKFQVLAAILMICLISGGFLSLRLLRTPHSVPLGTPRQIWCSIPAPGLSADGPAPALFGVAAASADDIWMVGALGGQTNSLSESSQTLIEHWDGKSLRVIHSPDKGENGDRLLDVAEVTPYDIWAVGSVTQPWPQALAQPMSNTQLPGVHTLIEHWDGRQWSIVPSPDGTTAANGLNELRHIAAISANDIWAIGYTGRLPYQDENDYRADENEILMSTYVTPLVEHWNGHTWSIVQLPSSLRAQALVGVAASADSNLWISGFSISGQHFRPLLIRWDGQKWQRIASLTAGDYWYSFNVQSANNVWAQGIQVTGSQGGLQLQGPTIIGHWDGVTWQEETLANPAFLSDSSPQQAIDTLVVNSFKDIWAAGGQSGSAGTANGIAPVFIVHWNGQSWQQVSLPQKYIGFLNILTVMGGRIWAAGTIYSGFQQIPGQLVETTC